jgi:hypothetical protein
MHLDAEQVQRLLHRERATAAPEAREHLAACGECRSALDAARRDEDAVHALLRHLDHPAPAITAEALAARARRPALAWGRRAAVVALGLGVAGAAYAAPGSPVPAWLRAAAEWVTGRSESPRQSPAAVQREQPAPAGIAVAPGEVLVIEFARPSGGRALVTLTDGVEVEVRASTGAAAFTADGDRLVVDNAGAADFEILVPREAPRIEIRVAGRRVFFKHGPRVTTEAVADQQGRFALSLAPAGP